MSSREGGRTESYWGAELESLGIKAKWKNQLNDVAELAALTENIKQTYYQDYKSTYDKDHKVDSSDLGYI